MAAHADDLMHVIIWTYYNSCTVMFVSFAFIFTRLMKVALKGFGRVSV